MWRDGQKRRVFVYRFVATGTIEEKVFQRQISKEGLQALVSAKSAGGGGGGGAKNLMSAEELRELFTYHEHSLSHTHDVLCREQGSEAQDEAEEEEQRREEGEGEGEGEEQQAGAPGEREAAGRPSVFKEQQGSPSTEEELAAWGHHSDPATVPDAVLQVRCAPSRATMHTRRRCARRALIHAACRACASRGGGRARRGPRART